MSVIPLAGHTTANISIEVSVNSGTPVTIGTIYNDDKDIFVNNLSVLFPAGAKLVFSIKLNTVADEIINLIDDTQYLLTILIQYD